MYCIQLIRERERERACFQCSIAISYIVTNVLITCSCCAKRKDWNTCITVSSVPCIQTTDISRTWYTERNNFYPFFMIDIFNEFHAPSFLCELSVNRLSLCLNELHINLKKMLLHLIFCRWVMHLCSNAIWLMSYSYIDFHF